jgi:hypothetical protein
VIFAAADTTRAVPAMGYHEVGDEYLLDPYCRWPSICSSGHFQHVTRGPARGMRPGGRVGFLTPGDGDLNAERSPG